MTTQDKSPAVIGYFYGALPYTVIFFIVEIVKAFYNKESRTQVMKFEIITPHKVKRIRFGGKMNYDVSKSLVNTIRQKKNLFSDLND